VPDEATKIAAELIKSRALDAATAGQSEQATQLQALARGLLDGRVTLYDASLVMQIAATPRIPGAAAAAAPLTAEARASAQRATALLDGGDATAAPAPAAAPATAAKPIAPPVAAPAAPSEQPPLALPTLPPTPGKSVTTKIYAVDNGSDGKANVAAIGAGANTGVTVGQIFVIKRKGQTIAQVKVVKVQPSLCYAEVIKGSLVDPKDDIKEGDQAIAQ
jgi:hypothetical protein